MSTNDIDIKTNQLPKLGLNRIEAARALGVSPATLHRLTQRGLIRPCRATYRPIYWVGELERFLKENSKPSEWQL
jgi:predicted site-specific integrase-resolvase